MNKMFIPKLTLRALLLCTCCYDVQTARAQTPELHWAKSMGGVNADQGKTLTVDDLGNVYSVSDFTGTVDFDPGPGVYNLTSVSTANRPDIAITKLDAAGNFLWARQISGNGHKESMDITVDLSGNVYLTGYFRDTVDFDPGDDIKELISIENDAFFCKFDASGNYVFSKQIGSYLSGSGAVGYSIVVDNAGYIYNMGYFREIVDFDPGPDDVFLTSNNLTDIYLAKYDPNGNYVWVKQFDGVDYADEAHEITLDNNNNIYITGQIVDTVDFDLGSGTFKLWPTSSGNRDIFVAKYDSAGNLQWAKQMGGAETEWGISIAVDHSGNVYSTGVITGTADLDPGTGVSNLNLVSGIADAYVSKLNANGNFVWAKVLPGGANINMPSDIAVDARGNVYTTGSVNGGYDSWGFYLIPDGVFITKLDAAGNAVWHYEINGTGNMGHRIKLDAYDNIYLTGNFQGTHDFDLGAGVTNLVAVGMTDVFVQKLKQNTCTHSNSTLTALACNTFVLNRHVYTASGTYEQTILNTSGCDSTITLHLTVGSLDTSVTVSGSTLTANATGPSYTYQWIDCNNGNAVIQGATQQSFTPSATGSYAVVITESDCRDTSSCFSITVTAIHEQNAGNIVRIYPNPSNGSIHLLTRKPMQKANVQVVNMLGCVLLAQENIYGDYHTINISSLADGIYYIILTEQGKVSRVKLVKK